MKILNFDIFLDGGTIAIECESNSGIELTSDKNIYCFDYRMRTTTEGKLYLGYPKDDNSNLINDSEKIELEIIEALKNYKDVFYQSTINGLINKYNK